MNPVYVAIEHFKNTQPEKYKQVELEVKTSDWPPVDQVTISTSNRIFTSDVIVDVSSHSAHWCQDVTEFSYLHQALFNMASVMFCTVFYVHIYNIGKWYFQWTSNTDMIFHVLIIQLCITWALFSLLICGVNSVGFFCDVFVHFCQLLHNVLYK